MKYTFPASLFLSCLGLFGAACSSDTADQPSCEGDSCDEVLASKPLAQCKTTADFKTTTGTLDCTPCGDVLLDRSGRGFLPAFVGNDALVRKVYMTFVDANKNKLIDQDEIDCPLEMPAIMAKLDKVDRNGTKKCPEENLTTRIVSETAALLGETQADYRAVTARVCDKRPEFGLLFSSFGFTGNPQAKGTGVHISEDGHPGEVEIIAFDQTEGVFNFYKTVGGAMRFFGSSIDFVAAGPGGPSLTSTRGCANCHPGGGLNMKELQAPWTHWSLQDDIKGADTLVESRAAYMGSLESGVNMEFNITEPGNDAWNVAKAKFLSTTTTAELVAARKLLKDDPLNPGQLADLQNRQLKKGLNATQLMLEPLFCSVQVNINAQGKSGVPISLVATETNELFFFGDLGIADSVFNAAIKPLNSIVPGIPGETELTTEFMVVERSAEDVSYINELLTRKVIDEAMFEDVAMVDFTRPVFSDDRCGLLALVPDLPPADRKPAKIRDALIDSITKSKPAQGSPAGQLLAHLAATKAKKRFDHQAILDAFGSACDGRTQKELARDGLKLRSLQRKLVFRFDGAIDSADGPGQHPLAVFEFEQTMPADDVQVTPSAAPDAIDQVHPDARFSPIDCTLVSAFVPVTSPDPAAPQ